MDPITMGLLASTAISAGGSILGGSMSAQGAAGQNAASIAWAREQQQIANAFSAEQAQKQMDFQERMSGSQYQRGMADMRQAGLNPVLAYQQGGASSPQGAMGSPSMSNAAKFENPMEHMGRAVTSAGQAGKDFIALQQVRANTTQAATAADLNAAQADFSKANTIKTAQDTITSAEDAARKRAETALITEQMKNPEAQRMLMGHQGTAAKAAAYASTRAGDYSKAQTDQLVNIGPGKFATEVMSPLSRLLDIGRRVYAAPPQSAVPLTIDMHSPNRGHQ